MGRGDFGRVDVDLFIGCSLRNQREGGGDLDVKGGDQ